jgi:hypothetical protein
MEVVLEPKFDHQQALPYGEEVASKRDRDFLEYVRRPKRATVVNSDGFLSLSHIDFDNGDCHRGHPVVGGRCVNCGLERSY